MPPSDDAKDPQAASNEPRRRSRKEGRLGNGWIGVDLDGTLAEWQGGKGSSHIGPPIPAMLERVKRWIGMDIEVRIFTARASVESHIPPVEAWLEEHGIGGLRVTNVKDYKMLQLWDDRAIQVVPNTGEMFKNSKWVDERKRILDDASNDDTETTDSDSPA